MEEKEELELELIREQVKIAEESYEIKETALKLQKWHLYAIWAGVCISLVNLCFNTLNMFLIITKK